ncbi:MAG: hypothetical protein QMD46_00325 [Methanomicrobiales archaeon]|nr:hypothetical protein [Methanomicrobiales archaeon]MDI6875871.1 hypothetical protein [Methanomicrobiales archaeon]
MRKTGILGLLAVLILLAAGCTEGTPSPVLVEYSRTGGIAGFDDHLVVHENGTAVLSRRTVEGAFFLDPTIMDVLRDDLEAADFPSLDERYPAPSPGADYITYRITYRNRTVTAETTAVPERLEPAIRTLDRIIQSQS